MKLSLLKQKRDAYHSQKGWIKKLQIIPDHDEVVWLDAYLKSLSKDRNVTDDSDISFENFKNFVEQRSTKKGLFSPEYLNSSNLSAVLFKEWQREHILSSPLIIEFKYFPSPLPQLNIKPLSLDFSKQLADLAHLPPTPNLAHNILADTQPKNVSFSLFSALPKYLDKNDFEKIFFDKSSPQNNITLKATSDYHNGTLYILGQKLLLRIKLFTKAQLESQQLRLLCIEMGKIFINFITQRNQEISGNILNVLKIQIERLISSEPATASLLDKGIPEIPDEFVADYIQHKINQNPFEPLALLLYTAEEINPTGIADTLEYLTNECLVNKTNGKKIAFMLIRRLNEADDMLHAAVPQNVNQAPKP